MSRNDIFATPISFHSPPSVLQHRRDHPVPRKGILSKGPLQTNKFYSNFHLGDQLSPAYTFPYSISWAGGKGVSKGWGLACSHIEAHQRVFGPEKYNGAAAYFCNPIGIHSMIISATELGPQTQISLDSITAFSARLLISRDDESQPSIAFPMVQGMPYVTAQFTGSSPLIQSGVFWKTVTRATASPKPHVTKYTFHLEDGTTWRLYGWRTKGDELDLRVTSNGRAVANGPFYGIIQICKDPKTPGSENLLDDGAAVFPLTLTLSGHTSGPQGTYSFNFVRGGHGTGNLYMYALPHHVESFTPATKSRLQPIRLQSTTKGMATLIKGTIWTMVETKLPIDMGFEPWDPKEGSVKGLSRHAKSLIRGAAAHEISQDMISQCNLNSMYFSGKALAKFAIILYVINDLIGDHTLMKTGLGQLKAAFATFAANQQQHPLVYDSAWGGVVSSASYTTGDPHIDFGNSYYNDHHFHYGYHILAAAYIGHLDLRWMKENKEYVNTLVRDIANPSSDDKYFPMWRNFDWYHGHSWAHGLYASWDGKESSSEDAMHAYAIKMWGKVSGDAEMEARGNLLLSVLARSLRHYYLYQNDNVVQPKEFIGNKAAGIVFEGKIDHTTFFSPDIEAIQGIHMIPILPSTPFIRAPKFVREEWDAYFSGGRIDKAGSAWKSIIYGSFATVEPKKAWRFFSSKEFESSWLDGGASLTWLLAYSADNKDANGGLATSLMTYAARTLDMNRLSLI
ncbi:family 81 glycoside hydrolase [Stachybotrys elegans]|uniref:glucan endo-1,3-beta-D-glucosidase n=1 Tax=Stachybotrys elegans TaxID=80388 RepID=A0A8K0SRV6_9HYPO|nr:family 81 glycoside hydrolase [Stachybotrys elegans]